MSKDFESRAEAIELNVKGLLSLLGGNQDDRARYWEIVKGVTTPAEYRLVESALFAAERQLNGAQESLGAVYEVAKKARVG